MAIKPDLALLEQQNTKASHQLNILVVEDSESDFELMNYHLKQAGLECSSQRVDNLSALNNYLHQKNWDIIVSDHNLPGFSASQALKLVRQTAPFLPFIIVSGNIGEDVAVEAMRSGVDDYLVKDRLQQLPSVVIRSIRTAQERKNLNQAELAKRESERRFTAIAENIPGIFVQFKSGNLLPEPEITFIKTGAFAHYSEAVKQRLEQPESFFNLLDSNQANDLKKTIIAHTNANIHQFKWEGQLTLLDSLKLRWFLLHAIGKKHKGFIVWDALLFDISDRKRTEQELKDSKVELRKVSSEFEKRQEQERAAIAREIHDDIGASLTKLKTDLAWLYKSVNTTQPIEEKLNDMRDSIEHLLNSSQRIAKDLRPGILDYGLIPALEWQIKDFEKRTQTQTRFRTNQETVDLNAEQNTVLFRILQESLTNIIKHANANFVEVELFASSQHVTLEIIDNGKGITNTDKLKKTSFGLRGMHERVTAFNGWVDINGTPEQGTTVMVSLPKNLTTPNEAAND